MPIAAIAALVADARVVVEKRVTPPADDAREGADLRTADAFA